MAEFAVKFDETKEGADYRAISPASAGSLVLGLLSPLALVGSLLWVIPALGIALAIIALRAIRQSHGDITGTRSAYAGLALCTIFAAAGPVKTTYTTYYLAEASRPMAEAWFEFLRLGEPHKAFQLTLPETQRRALDDLLWNYYRSSKESREELEKFVASPVPRIVLEYGQKCQVRFYEINRVTTGPTNDTIELVYAVTYPDSAGAKKTFFALVTVVRLPVKSGEVFWRITGNIGGFRPASLGE
jgi:hypothetical protein